MTMADFWGCNKVLSRQDDDLGLSLVIVNTQKGKALFEKIKSDINCEPVDYNEAIKYNPAIVKSVGKTINRTIFFEKLNVKTLPRLVNKYCSEGFKRDLKEKIKHFLGNLRA